MDINVLNCGMNDKQKLFVMVAVGSIALLILSLTVLHWSTSEPLVATVMYDTHIPNPSYHKSLVKTNWLGIIAIFNIAFCLTGFFLFKDK